jgi:peptide/nickel transport system permease protein
MDKKFGLDQPVWKQYLTYMGDMARFDFNYSILNYPRKVIDIIGEAMPWTITLLLMTTILAFLIGNILGALMAWPRSPKFLSYAMTPLMMMGAIPYFLLGLIMVYIFGFWLGVFPMFGGYKTGTIPTLSFKFATDVAWHGFLPALSIILVSMGGWALGMRSLMIMTQGEDYVLFAEAKGLNDRTIFTRYAMQRCFHRSRGCAGAGHHRRGRGAVKSSSVFGIGTVLYVAIRYSDYYLVQELGWRPSSTSSIPVRPPSHTGGLTWSSLEIRSARHRAGAGQP